MSTQFAQAAASPLEKHRLESLNYSVDWAQRLATGVALSGAPAVAVLRDDDDSFTDVSTQFAISSLSISGTKSLWRLGSASVGDQDADAIYYVRVSQGTDDSQTLVSIHQLIVSELADADAP